MKRTNFSYKDAGKNEHIDSMVRAFSDLTEAYLDTKFPRDKYEENNKTFSESIVKFCVEAIGQEYTGLDMVKNPQITYNANFKTTFATVISQVITPVVPKLISNTYNELYDVKQTGFGDNAAFQVRSNELFIVNEGAEGIAHGGYQTIANNEYTVTASKKEVAVGVDWYHIAAGKQDWGAFGVKVALSFANYISASVIKTLTNVVASSAEMNKRGIGGYTATGLSDSNWMTIARNVSLANGGAQVYALGTQIGLSTVMPQSTSVFSGFVYGERDKILTEGVLDRYKGVPLMIIDQALNPYTINTTPQALVNDNYIYFLPLGADKPVKVVFEGNQVVVQEDYSNNRPDESFGLIVSMRIGTDVIVGNKFGVLTK